MWPIVFSVLFQFSNSYFNVCPFFKVFIQQTFSFKTFGCCAFEPKKLGTNQVLCICLGSHFLDSNPRSQHGILFCLFHVFGWLKTWFNPQTHVYQKLQIGAYTSNLRIQVFVKYILSLITHDFLSFSHKVIIN